MKPYVVRFVEETTQGAYSENHANDLQAKPSQYPKEVLAKLKLMPSLAIEIANRWALGWPQRVKALIEAGQYLQALTSQERQEREVLSNPGLSHLARHEIVQEYGLSLEPPTIT